MYLNRFLDEPLPDPPSSHGGFDDQGVEVEDDLDLGVVGEDGGRVDDDVDGVHDLGLAQGELGLPLLEGLVPQGLGAPGKKI